MNRNWVVSMLDRYCDLQDNFNGCNDCIFNNLGCEFEDMSDADLHTAVGILLDIKSDSTSTHVGTVDHPKHYQGKNECITVMRSLFGDEAVKGFCRCNAYKYRFRAEHKNGAEDIRKAEWYESYLIGMDKEDKGNG